MADVNFYLRGTTSKKETGTTSDKETAVTSNKESAVMLFFSYQNQRFKVGTVEHINPKFWDNENQRAKQTKNFPTHPEFNTRLKNLKDSVLDVYRTFLNDNNQQQPTPYQIKDLIKAKLFPEAIQDKNVETNLLGFTELFIKETEIGKRLTEKGTPITEGTIKVYRTLKRNLTAFKTKKKYDLNFENIGLAFFEDFKEFMTFDLLYRTSTVAKHIRTLKTIINDAIERGLTKTSFTGKRYKAVSEITETIYLSKSELQTLYTLDLSENSRLDKVRDLFLVGCWTGLRFSDFNDINSKNIIGDFFKIKTQKTGKEVIIPIHPSIKMIMKKYEGKTENSLPPTISNQKMNEYLKEIGKEAEMKEVITLSYTKGGKKVLKCLPKYSRISSHTARRSFATNMYLDNFPTISIMAITGHTTESSFMKYIRVTPQEHADKLLQMWQTQTPVLKVV